MIDSIIFSSFLVLILSVGFLSSRGIITINDYALGGRNFSTATLVSTIIATCISGRFFFTVITQTYNSGLNFIWTAAAGDFVAFLLTAYFFAPRMQEFLGKLSIADSLGGIYGKHIRVISALAGFIGTTGIIAIQLKVGGLIFEYAFGLNQYDGALISGIIITLYSASGGIKSVTFTDVVQFATFAFTIPVLAYFIFNYSTNIDDVVSALSKRNDFNPKIVFDFTNKDSLYYFFLFIYFAIPAFHSDIFQRISMAKNIQQVTKSFSISAGLYVIAVLMTAWIAIGLLTISPNISAEVAMKKVVFDSGIIGMKSLALIGVMAMVMSTVDSMINSSAILMTNDFLGVFDKELNNVSVVRTISLLIGAIAIFLSLRQSDLLELAIFAHSFYMPVVTVPFIMTILGFRSTGLSVGCGMITGFIVALAWNLQEIKFANPVIIGMSANLSALFAVHYLFNQRGGWVGVKQTQYLRELRHKRAARKKAFIHAIKNFNLINICAKNSPNNDSIIALSGIFLMLSSFVCSQLVTNNCDTKCKYVLNMIYPTIFFASFILTSYPMWLPSWKKSNFIGFAWNAVFLICGICFSFFVILISNFSAVQLMILMTNILILALFVNWQWAVALLFTGFSLSYFIFNGYVIDNNHIHSFTFANPGFKIMYLLLFITATLITFLRPRQNDFSKVISQNEHLHDKIDAQDKEVERVNEMKDKFLHNIPHESHTPINIVYGHLQTLDTQYDIFDDETRKLFISDARNETNKFMNYTQNIQMLAEGLDNRITIKKQNINLSDLIYEIIEENKTLHISAEEENDRIWDLDINDDIFANCDIKYMKKAISNLVENSIKYCKKGKIYIKLEKENNNLVQFTISDEGCGIPKGEIQDIFEAFVISSETKQRSEGKGIGLTVTRNIMELHNGTISAYNNNAHNSDFEKGVTFYCMFNIL